MYLIVYDNAINGIVAYVIPLVLLVVFNATIIIKLYEGQKYPVQNGIRSAHEPEIGMSVMMAVLITMFLVSQTPSYVNQFLDYFVAAENYHCGHPYFYFYHISNLIVSSNSCLNFVVYCAAGRKFRKDLLDMKIFGKRCGSCCFCSRNSPQPRDSVTSSASQRVSETISSFLPILY
jgi:NADH:ubiquinone oxidoreductase subunit 5 (subunit L)/multisubunit Na+/H+ antiporter MnhA subunit